MDGCRMFYETDWLLREDLLQEAHMPTELLRCTKCHKGTRFTAKADEVIIVKCERCGHKMEVVIEGKSKKAA
jgi:predicted nucleic acid-binding Zn ribbon protein